MRRKDREKSTNLTNSRASNLAVSWRINAPSAFVSSFAEVVTLIRKVSLLVRQLPWTHNLLFLSRCKQPEERDFCLRLSIRQRWGKPKMEWQLASVFFEHTVFTAPDVSPSVTHLHPEAASVAEYQMTLPDKKLLRAKLHEFYALAEQASATSPERLSAGSDDD